MGYLLSDRGMLGLLGAYGLSDCWLVRRVKKFEKGLEESEIIDGEAI